MVSLGCAFPPVNRPQIYSQEFDDHFGMGLVELSLQKKFPFSGISPLPRFPQHGG
jgi:hypothetical protein